MKRATAVVVAFGFALVACGGGDDDTSTPADEPAEEPAEEPADEPAAEPAEEPADEPADEPAAEPAEEPADEPADGAADGESDDDGGGISVSSLDDIPQECQDLMAEFLRDLEPIVSPVNWSQATLSDFETIAGDFESRANEFDTASADAGCDDLDFDDDDDGFGLIIEFADDVAPGTVPFFEFLDGMMGGGGSTGDGDTADGAGIETCDDAIAAIEGLMADYDGFSSVPVSEMAVLTDMTTAMMSCSPEQLEFFESDTVNDFLSR